MPDKSILARVPFAIGKALGVLVAAFVKAVLSVVALVVAAIIILYVVATNEPQSAPKPHHCPPVVAESSNQEPNHQAGGV